MAQNDPWAAFRIKPAAQGPSPTDVVIAPPDPYKQSAEARARVDQSLQIESANRARTDQRLQMEEADRKRREWEATHNPDGSPKVAAGAGKPLREGDVTRLTTMGDNLSAFDRLNTTFQNEYAGNTLTGGMENTIQSAFSGFGTPGQQQWWADVADFDNKVRNSQFGASLTPGEKAEYDKTTINPSMDPKIIRENLARRSRILEQSAMRRVTGLKAAGWNKDEIDAYIGAQLSEAAGGTPAPNSPDAQIPGAAPVAAPATPDPRALGNIPGADGGTPMGLSQGNTRTAPLAGVEDRYRQLLGAGASGDDLVAYLQSVGVNDEQALTQARQQANYRDRFPKVPIDQYPVNFSQQLPMSSADQAINAAGQSAGGAYAMNAAQALTGGTLDNIIGMTGGNEERARAGRASVSESNPVASTLGTVSGGVMAAMGGELALARAGMAPGLARGVVSDATYGAASGAGNADNGDRFTNALAGGLVGAGTSALATGATNALARGLTPSTQGVNTLYDAGVTNMTFGQRGAAAAAGQTGMRAQIGNAINSAEQKLQSLPVVGSAIRGARQEARDSFQIGAFNDALKEVGEALPKGMRPGTGPNAYAQATFNRVYSQARSGMKMVPDAELQTEIAAMTSLVDTLGPQATARLKSIIDNNVRNRFVNGELSGKAFKNTVSDLGKKAAIFRRGNTAEDQALADAIDSLQTALDNAARRHSDPDAVALLDAADAGYAKLVRIEDAARRAGGDAGTFTPTQFDRAVQNTSGGVRSKAYLRGDALMQDYAEQGMALVDTVPNSGSAERVFAGAAATGAAVLSPKALAVFGGLLGAYAPGTRKVMQAATGPAGPTRQAISQQLRKRARLAGSTSAASAAALSQGTASVP
jgi:hypothetical protein